MNAPILHDNLPFLPWMDPRTNRLPGILPVEGDDWLRMDEAYSGQMARRDALIADHEPQVHALLPKAAAAAAELYALILSQLKNTPGFKFAPGQVTRPDGVTVPLRPEQPLLTLGRLVQEDLLILEAEGDEHMLTGAILCFPASWSLHQKIGRKMMAIHSPVAPYTPEVGKRVQRLFDAVRPEQALWRMNHLTYDDPELFQPRLEGENRPRPVEHRYIRCERQCLMRLPETRAVIFSVHTYLVPATAIDPEAVAALIALHS